jgi:heat shock protein HtpX
LPLFPSLARRAALAVLLLLGFYVLVIASAGISLSVRYAEWTYAGSLHLKLALFCVLAASSILWSSLPRLDRSIPPGPALEPKEHSQLFEALSSIAQATKQEMPSGVHMISDMSAWGAHHCGIKRCGGRRVMGLDLPLLQVLSVSQLRAVLAHEFGHFHGGDTKLGPWLYKTRAAIGRTLQRLAERSSLLQKPFLWYGKVFLRVTHAVSRDKEFAADELTACLVGSRPLSEGLKLIHGAALAFNVY